MQFKIYTSKISIEKSEGYVIENYLLTIEKLSNVHS